MLIILRYILKRDTFSLVKSSCSALRYISLLQGACRQQHNQLQRRYATIGLQPLHNYQQWRGKTKKSSKQQQQSRMSAGELDDDEPDDNPPDMIEDILGDKHSRTMKVTLNSTRADLLLKAGLGIARNKVDALFYDSKIWINGRKLLKKSAQLDEGDEIDVLRGPSPTNPDHLIVSRVEIVSVTPRIENFAVTLRRHKTLIIEGYAEQGSTDGGQEK